MKKVLMALFAVVLLGIVESALSTQTCHYVKDWKLCNRHIGAGLFCFGEASDELGSASNSAGTAYDAGQCGTYVSASGTNPPGFCGHDMAINDERCPINPPDPPGGG